MDLSESVAVALYPPSCAYIDIEHDCTTLIEGNESSRFDLDDNLTDELLAKDQPKKCDDAPRRWRIDGTASMGTQLFATPICVSDFIPPRRIDLYLPDQYRQDQALRNRLELSKAFCVQDGRADRLAISQVLCKALDEKSNTQHNFFDRYVSMPFGSRLIVENLDQDFRKVKLHLVPRYEAERQMRTLESLKAEWACCSLDWPEAIDLESLRVVRQLHDTISHVKIPKLAKFGREVHFAFKAATQNVKNVYHELFMLLQMPSHSNIMTRPRYVVTLQDRYGRGDKVCGFLLEYVPGGNLAHALAERRLDSSIDQSLQLKWARQIARTLLDIHGTQAGFYSELKPDNLLLHGVKGQEDIMFIDFEQRSNWMDFSAPEVHHAEFLKYLADESLTSVPAEERSRYKALYQKHVQLPQQKAGVLHHRPGGATAPWTAFTAEQVEAAEVYSLGMVLYCIFEQVPSNKNCMTKVFAKDEDYVEFPSFDKTPPKIRSLIVQCTRGCDVDTQAEFDVVRVGSKVWPRGKCGRDGEPAGTAKETLFACQQMWKLKLRHMEEFYAAKERYENPSVSEASSVDSVSEAHSNHATNGGEGVDKWEKDKTTLGYPLRPSLKDVLRTLDQVAEGKGSLANGL